MGHCFNAVFIEKKKSAIEIVPNKDIYKWNIVEQCRSGCDIVTLVYNAVKNNPRHIAWINDGAPYTRKEIHLPWFADEEKFLDNVIYMAWERGYEDQKPDKNPLKRIEYPSEHYNLEEVIYKGFLVNHTLKLYVDLAEYVENCGYKTKKGLECVDPLPMLTLTGGHFVIWEDKLADAVTVGACGLWAFSLIEFTDKKPKDYKKEEYCFATADILACIYEKKYGRDEGGRLMDPNNNVFSISTNVLHNMQKQHRDNKEYADKIWESLDKKGAVIL